MRGTAAAQKYIIHFRKKDRVAAYKNSWYFSSEVQKGRLLFVTI